MTPNELYLHLYMLGWEHVRSTEKHVMYKKTTGSSNSSHKPSHALFVSFNKYKDGNGMATHYGVLRGSKLSYQDIHDYIQEVIQ